MNVVVIPALQTPSGAYMELQAALIEAYQLQPKPWNWIKCNMAVSWQSVQCLINGSEYELIFDLTFIKDQPEWRGFFPASPRPPPCVSRAKQEMNTRIKDGHSTASLKAHFAKYMWTIYMYVQYVYIYVYVRMYVYIYLYMNSSCYKCIF